MPSPVPNQFTNAPNQIPQKKNQIMDWPKKRQKSLLINPPQTKKKLLIKNSQTHENKSHQRKKIKSWTDQKTKPKNQFINQSQRPKKKKKNVPIKLMDWVLFCFVVHFVCGYCEVCSFLADWFSTDHLLTINQKKKRANLERGKK